MEMNYKIIYAKRKSVSMKIEADGSLSVRAPYGLSREEIGEIVRRNATGLERIRERVLSREKAQMEADKEQLEARLREVALPLVDKYSHLMGRTPNKITFTNAKSRYGSCSSKGNVCFSRYLAMYTNEAIEYVVVHELAHLFEMNHSKRFYNIVEKFLPQWREYKKLLKTTSSADKY